MKGPTRRSTNVPERDEMTPVKKAKAQNTMNMKSASEKRRSSALAAYLKTHRRGTLAPPNQQLFGSTEDSAQATTSCQRVSPKPEPRWCGHHLELPSTIPYPTSLAEAKFAGSRG
ncbi:hypothetical protein M422DRAFT_271404 [Sphaerobolus stellatus SS14]|uniref:Uncharacterized protein n=1 Tax=Sphaerobolus stellatus (strain SS14) TaxID=990650 RepID=A0A0C9UPZ7_SPHS4|nr:hypothetical protein M422DRAFT_271404 [Sphaerobolus stellatus SS14]